VRLIIDTDAGVDDAQALLLALSDPTATVEAITTVTGNVHVDKVVRNVGTVLDIMNRDIPVYRGAERPLLHPWHPEEAYHGSDGLGNWKDRPTTARQPEAEHAVHAILRLANTYPGELTLVALGPLTNLALAVSLDPALPLKLKRFVFMGGTISAMGNTPMVTAEWNMYCDPEAAHILLQSIPKATMLSWETTVQHPFTWQQCDELLSMNSVAARFFKGISDSSMRFFKRIAPDMGYLLPDPLAIAITLEPALVKRSVWHYVTVEVRGEYTRGQTVIDYRGTLNNDPNVQIVTEVDISGVFDRFKEALS
jgi:purine nucleosidase